MVSSLIIQSKISLPSNLLTVRVEFITFGFYVLKYTNANLSKYKEIFVTSCSRRELTAKL